MGSAEGMDRWSPGGQGRSVLVLALECKKHLGNKMNEADCKCEPLPRLCKKVQQGTGADTAFPLLGLQL